MVEYFHVQNKEELKDLNGKSAKYKDLHFSFSKKRIAEMEELLGAKNGYQLFAKDKNGKTIGYISGGETIHPGCFTIHELFVDPEFQGQGIGSELVKKIFEFTGNINISGVIVQTEFENIPAQKLYEKIGFIKIDNSDWTDGITYKLIK